MSWSSPPVFMLFLLLLILDVSVTKAEGNLTVNASCNLQCCAALDATLLQEYVSNLNITDLLSNVIRTNDSADIETLPFGTLKSDWTRLLLIQNRQLKDEVLRDNLLRLSRLILAAYFDVDDNKLWDESNDNENDELTIVPTILSTVSEMEFQDQQANNITLSSTAQKKSSWINMSSSKVSSTTSNYDNVTQSSSENSDGNQDSLSYLPSSTILVKSIEVLNFNRTSFSNETNGSNSNSDKEDAGLSTKEHPTLKSSVYREDNIQSDEAVKVSELSISSEKNVALHDRNKENYETSRQRTKENKDANDEAQDVSRFFNSTSSENTTNHIKSVERLFALEEKKVNESTQIKSIGNSSSSAENTNTEGSFAKSLDQSDNVNNNASDNNNSDATEEVYSSLQSDSFEFNSTKSIEDYFSTEDDNCPSIEENATVDPNAEKFFESEKLINLNDSSNFVVSQSIESNEALLTKSLEALFDELKINGTNDEVVMPSIEVLFNETIGVTSDLSSSSNEPDESLQLENATTTVSIADQFFLTTLASKSVSDSNVENIGTETTESDDDVTTAGKKNHVYPRTVAQLILQGSDSASTLYPEEMALGSITTTSLNENGTVEYFNSPATITLSPSVVIDRDNSGEKGTRVVRSEIERKNQTTSGTMVNKNDDLFKENTSKDQHEKNDYSTTITALVTPSVDSTSSSQKNETEMVSSYPILGQMRVTFQHGPKNNTTASGKLREPITNSLRNLDTSEEQSNSNGDLLNPTSMSLRSKRYRRNIAGITMKSNDRMYKRKSREHTELVERQYRSF